MFYKWPSDFLNLQVGKKLQMSKAPGNGGVWNRILEKTNLSPQVWDFPSESTEGPSRAQDTAVRALRIYIPSCLHLQCLSIGSPCYRHVHIILPGKRASNLKYLIMTFDIIGILESYMITSTLQHPPPFKFVKMGKKKIEIWFDLKLIW